MIEIFYFTGYLFSVKFVGIVFTGTVSVTSTISSQIVNESPIILSKYVVFSQVHVLGFLHYIYIYFTDMVFPYILGVMSTFIIIPLLTWVIFSTIKFTFTFVQYMFQLCFWFIYSFYHI